MSFCIDSIIRCALKSKEKGGNCPVFSSMAKIQVFSNEKFRKSQMVYLSIYPINRYICYHLLQSVSSILEHSTNDVE